ncbi:MAG: hypothetical protein GY801_45375 [bacterium]|nr:hypothetical protein [bacterium]
MHKKTRNFGEVIPVLILIGVLVFAYVEMEKLEGVQRELQDLLYALPHI